MLLNLILTLMEAPCRRGANAKDLMERKAAGAYANVDFGPSDFAMRRYTLNATAFESPNAAVEADPLMGSGADSSIADDWFNQ